MIFGIPNSRRKRAIRRSAPIIETLDSRVLLSATYYVSTKGNDANAGTTLATAWRHIQEACNEATPGSIVDVMAGRYDEKLTVNVSGDAVDGFITFQAVGKVTVDGKGVAGSDIIYINNENYIRIVGFNLCDDLRVNNGSGIRVTSADDHIELDDNHIYNITGLSAMGITAYGTDPDDGISNLVINGNEVYNCQPAPSEAISLNGNVHDFSVTNNYVHNINGIGIDCLGGEMFSPDPATDYARNGVVSGNRVALAKAINPILNGAPQAAGIVVDGAQNTVVEQNVCWQNMVGIYVACVEPDVTALNDIVRDNIVYDNTEVGISIGGSEESQGRVVNCLVNNNTLYHNSAKGAGQGEIRIQFASASVVENNIIDGIRGETLINSDFGAVEVTSNFNLFYSPDGPAGAHFMWNDRPVIGLNAWLASSASDVNSPFAAPIFLHGSRDLYRTSIHSPGINAGDPAFVPGAGETDFLGQPRIQGGRVDIGA
jgi:hypothetical protein